MNRFRIGVWTAAWVASLAVAAFAQSAGPEALSLWGEPDPQVRKREHAFGVNATLEWWRAELEITDSSSENPPLPTSTLENGVTFFAQHSSAILSLEYAFLGLVGAEIRAHVGVGYESVSTTLEDDVTPQTFDTRFEEDFLFEAGAAFVYKLTKADVRGSLLFRMGESEADRPSPQEIEYEYTLIRGSIEGGLEAMEGVRPFLGFRYTLYESEWEISGGFPQTVTYELELEQPFGVFVGIELGAGQGAGRLEIDFLDVDTVGVAVSVGLGF